ncbi:Peroxisomal membrane protein PMP27 [Kappamyces sp. JEL0680]|nr:Peroxisomal membrane protein PMP27 [Kappamyces sp. JEL0680]
MFRSVQFVQDFLQAVGVSDSIEQGMAMIKAFALTIWMLVDHAQWMHKVGYIKLSDEKRMAEIHSKAWFVGLLFGALQSGYKLKKLYAAPPKDVKDFRKKEEKLTLGLIKNGTDLIIPSARLGWVDVSDGVVGLAGTITSFIGIRDTWPGNK